jgi:Arc/MetJ-type ribon-helix-helix transcriptional regulator
MRRDIGKVRTVTLTVKLPEQDYEALKLLVRSGLYINVTDAIRTAVRHLIWHDSSLKALLDRIRAGEAGEAVGQPPEEPTPDTL